MPELRDPDPRVQRTRRKVVRAALELLQEDGPEGVSHQRVAERAAVGRSTVYRHWPDRWSLISDALDSLSPWMTLPPGAPVRESLITLLERLCDRLESPVAIAMGSLISRAEWEPGARTLLDGLLAHAANELGKVLERGRREEGLRPDIPLETAQAVIAGPFLYERFIAGRVISRSQIPKLVDGLLEWWRRPSGSGEAGATPATS